MDLLAWENIVTHFDNGYKYEMYLQLQFGQVFFFFTLLITAAYRRSFLGLSVFCVFHSITAKNFPAYFDAISEGRVWPKPVLSD